MSPPCTHLPSPVSIPSSVQGVYDSRRCEHLGRCGLRPHLHLPADQITMVMRKDGGIRNVPNVVCLLVRSGSHWSGSEEGLFCTVSMGRHTYVTELGVPRGHRPDDTLVLGHNPSSFHPAPSGTGPTVSTGLSRVPTRSDHSVGRGVHLPVVSAGRDTTSLESFLGGVPAVPLQEQYHPGSEGPQDVSIPEYHP